MGVFHPTVAGRGRFRRPGPGGGTLGPRRNPTGQPAVMQKGVPLENVRQCDPTRAALNDHCTYRGSPLGVLLPAKARASGSPGSTSSRSPFLGVREPRDTSQSVRRLSELASTTSLLTGIGRTRSPCCHAAPRVRPDPIVCLRGNVFGGVLLLRVQEEASGRRAPDDRIRPLGRHHADDRAGDIAIVTAWAMPVAGHACA